MWISPSCQVMVSGDRWLETVVFAAGETPVLARAAHTPLPVAVWILLALRVVLVLLVCVFPCWLCVSQCFCNAKIFTELICKVEL